MSPTLDAKTSQRLRALIEHAAEVPNEFVGYHVDKARALHADLEAVTAANAKATQHLAILKQKETELRARLAAHLETIMFWDSNQAPEPGAAEH